MGVWIEITLRSQYIHQYIVAPFVGVWIEMSFLPTGIIAYAVAPFVGVWIEILKLMLHALLSKGRSLCGSVD